MMPEVTIFAGMSLRCSVRTCTFSRALLLSPQNIRLLQQATIPPELLAAVRAMVAKVRDSKPDLMGYYICDEPSGRTIHPAALRQVYEAIRDTDPYHPVFLSDAIFCLFPFNMFNQTDFSKALRHYLLASLPYLRFKQPRPSLE